MNIISTLPTHFGSQDSTYIHMFHIYNVIIIWLKSQLCFFCKGPPCKSIHMATLLLHLILNDNWKYKQTRSNIFRYIYKSVNVYYFTWVGNRWFSNFMTDINYDSSLIVMDGWFSAGHFMWLMILLLLYICTYIYTRYNCGQITDFLINFRVHGYGWVIPMLYGKLGRLSKILMENVSR